MNIDTSEIKDYSKLTEKEKNAISPFEKKNRSWV